jgi:hypothetical protein
MEIEDLENEVWIAWPNNPLYKVSNLNRVKSYRPTRKNPVVPYLVNIKVRPDGYCQVSMVDDSKPMYSKDRQPILYLHRLVATLHCPNPDNLPEVNHDDGNKQNCAAHNLKWCTHADNVKHTFEKLGRKMPTGKDHWNFGKTYSDEQKEAMSKAKLGENHPKFKGYYVKDGNMYASAKAAEDATGENKKTISRQAKRNANGWTFAKKAPDKMEVTSLNTFEWDVNVSNPFPSLDVPS